MKNGNHGIYEGNEAYDKSKNNKQNNTWSIVIVVKIGCVYNDNNNKNIDNDNNDKDIDNDKNIIKIIITRNSLWK